MSNLDRILEIMTYKVGLPINEQKKVLLEAYIPKFPAVFDILKNVRNSVYSIQAPMTKWGELTAELDRRFPNMTFEKQMDELSNKFNNAGPGFGMTNDTAEELDTLLVACFKELVEYVDIIPDVKSRFIWWAQIDDTAYELFKIKNKVDNLPGKVDDSTAKQISQELKNVKSTLDSLIETYPYGKMKDDCNKVVNEISTKIFPKTKKSISGEIKRAFLAADFVSSLRRWFDIFLKTPLKEPQAGISDYQKLLDEIENLSDELTIDLRKPVSLGMSGLDVDKMRRLTELIFAFKRDFNDNVWGFFETLHNEGKISDELFNHVKKQKENKEPNVFLEWIDEVDKFRLAKEGTAEKEAAESAGVLALRDEMNSLIEIIKFNPAFLVLRLFTKSGRENLGKDALTLATRLFWLTVWKDPRTPKELLRLRNVRGASRTTLIGAKIMSILFWQLCIVPFLYTVIATPAQKGMDLLEGTPLSFGKDLVKWGKDDYKNPNWDGWNKFYENFMDAVPNEYTNWFDNSEFTKQDFLEGIFFFTNLDNVIIGYGQLISGETSAEEKETANQDRQRTQQELLDELRQIQERGDAESQERIRQLEEELRRREQEGGETVPETEENTTNETTIQVGGTVSGTETGFKNWLGTEGTPSYGWEFVKFQNGVGHCKKSDDVRRYYWANNQWTEM
jgi:hypothetical protein